MSAPGPLALGEVVDASWFAILGDYAPDIGDELVPADDAVDLFWECYWQSKAAQGLVIDQRLGVWTSQESPSHPVSSHLDRQDVIPVVGATQELEVAS